jgi:hypothetical protein
MASTSANSKKSKRDAHVDHNHFWDIYELIEKMEIRQMPNPLHFSTSTKKYWKDSQATTFAKT